MTHEPHNTPAADEGHVEMPRPTVAPLVLSLGLVLLAAGAVVGTGFLVVGGVVLVTGLSMLVADLLPGRGHAAEPLVEPERRVRPIAGQAGTVRHLAAGMPGYRLRLPTEVHPISAGLWGGLIGGAIMTLPALAYGVLSGHGLWYPINLLAGMVLPGVGASTVEELEQFRLSLLLVAAVIHVVMSAVLGLLYGVLLPTLPDLARPLAWGGLLMPLLWTAVSYTAMGYVNPVLQHGVDWPWFIASQFLFGAVAAAVVMRAGRLPAVASGLLGGLVGGLVMPVPAVLWSLGTKHGVWYPVNLLAAMARPSLGALPAEELRQFHADWLAAGLGLHAAMSAGFGLVYGLLLPRLPAIPGPISWGGLLMPLLWSATSYSLMGVVNPALQQRVDWAWFIVSQFVFGLTAAVVVYRTETIPVPPAGQGPDREANYVTG